MSFRATAVGAGVSRLSRIILWLAERHQAGALPIKPVQILLDFMRKIQLLETRRESGFEFPQMLIRADWRCVTLRAYGAWMPNTSVHGHTFTIRSVTHLHTARLALSYSKRNEAPIVCGSSGLDFAAASCLIPDAEDRKRAGPAFNHRLKAFSVAACFRKQKR